MTSKLVVNTIESDTGISSVSFASSISMSSTSKFFFSAAGIDIGADTNINRPASGVLGFNINGSEKVRINSNGFIGINTSSILAPLHTYNDTNNTIARLESGDATCRLQLKDSAGEGYVIASGDNLILANTSSITERLRITSTGQMGLGVTPNWGNSAYNGLHVHSSGSTNAYVTLTNNATGSTSSSDGFSLAYSSNDINFLNRENGNMIFTTGGAERLRIDSSGHMGLGTNNPSSFNSYARNLIIAQSSSDAGITISAQDAGSEYGSLHFSGGTTVRAYIDQQNGTTGRMFLMNKSNGYMGFGTNNTERLRILSDGKIQFSSATDNVIHTSSNSSRLRIFGGSNESVSNGGALTLHGVSHSAGNYTDLAAGSGGHIQFRLGTSEKLRIMSDGELRLLSENGNNSDTPGIRFRGGSSTQKANFARIHSRMVSNWGGQLQFKVKNDNGSLSDAYQTAMIMNHNAHVTKPNNPSFHVGNPNLAGYVTGQVWRCHANAIYSNVGSHYNNSNGRFTAPVAGQYFFFHWGMSQSANQTCDVYSRRNGSRDQIGTSFNHASGAQHDQFGCSYVRTLSAGDYVDVYTSNGNVYNNSDGRHGGWGGWLIG